MDNKKRLLDLKKFLDLEKKEQELKEIELKMQSSAFWETTDQAGTLKKYKDLKTLIEKVLQLEIFVSENNSSQAEDLFSELEIFTYFDGKHDKDDVFFSIHSGSGGVESMDFAAMLERMYLRFFEKRSFKYTLLDKSYGEEAGIKSVYYAVSGDFCYGFLKNESGTHRLIRQSPFNSASLRQTSFAKVEVIPQIKKNILQIKDSDLEITTMHSGGHGGQNVNKVETGVRIRYIPENITVACTTSRSQPQNKELALELIYSKINEIQEKKEREQVSKLKGENVVASFGSQIRTYTLHPYSMVKDHRSGITVQEADSVLAGNLDAFIDGNVRVLK